MCSKTPISFHFLYGVPGIRSFYVKLAHFGVSSSSFTSLPGQAFQRPASHLRPQHLLGLRVVPAPRPLLSPALCLDRGAQAPCLLVPPGAPRNAADLPRQRACLLGPLPHSGASAAGCLLRRPGQAPSCLPEAPGLVLIPIPMSRVLAQPLFRLPLSVVSIWQDRDSGSFTSLSSGGSL